MSNKFIRTRCWRFWRLIVAIANGMAWRLTDYARRFAVWDDELSLGVNVVRRGADGK